MGSRAAPMGSASHGNRRRGAGAPPCRATVSRRVVAALFCVLPLAACDDLRFPRDPNRTLETVLATGEMTVAAVDHPPWVVVDNDGAPSGAEVELVQRFASDLGVSVEWRRMAAFEALEGLGKGEVDLAVGGFERKAVTPTPGAAPSYAYFREALVVGVRPGAPVPEELDGEVVFVPPEEPATQLVRNKGGVPVRELTGDVTLAAVPHWQLEPLGWLPTGVVLRRGDHVVAVPQGENAWLMRVEGFLRSEPNAMRRRLIETLR